MHDVIDKHSNLDLFRFETLYSFFMGFFQYEGADSKSVGAGPRLIFP